MYTTKYYKYGSVMLAKNMLTWTFLVSTVLGLPVKTCINPHDGSELLVREGYHDRCNVCTCQENGQITCSDRTCKRRRVMGEAVSGSDRSTRNTYLFEVDFVQL